MIRNYIKTAFRSLMKNKGFTALNIIGLAIGLASCLLITLYVVDELSYDKYNVNANRIFRITETVKLNGNEASYAGTPQPLQEALKQFPEIEKTTRFFPVNSLFLSPKKFFLRNGDKKIEEKHIVFAESSVFDVFTLPVVNGKPALDEPNTAVITESAAKKYFDKTNAVGETLTINDTTQYKITAVIKDIPEQSHFNYDFFLSYSSLPESRNSFWGYSGVHNYVLLKPGADTKKLEAAILDFEYKNYPSSMHTDGNYLKVGLVPLTDIHLKSTALFELGKTGTMQYVYIFSAIAFFILLIACVNFMNLSTARSSNRAKEIGVRKILGSARKYLVAQFLTESIMLTLGATVIAVLLALMCMPMFNQVAAKNLSIDWKTFTWLLPALIGIVLLVGLLAGLYPAFYLSAFRPIEVLKGKLTKGFKAGFLRSFLVVFQFAISVFLIIGTIVIFNQLNYIRNKDLGFNRNQVLVIKNVTALGSKAKILKDAIKQMPDVVNATMSSYTPTGTDRKITGMFPQLPIDIKQDVLSEFWPVDEDYVNTMGIALESGRNFSSTMASDSTGLIVNQAFVNRFGFKDPLNKPIYRNSTGLETFHIIGVMKDFNFSSLRDKINPVALVYNEDRGAISARVKTTDMKGLLANVENKWKELLPNQQMDYAFMDEQFDAAYRSEQRSGSIFVAFSFLAILIACLGLFGLAAYAAEQRYKEIGIRKVLGASAGRIVGMLSIDFVKLVFIAILIASPLAWLAMNKWLQDYAYRVNMSWWIIVVAGAMAIIVALTTICFQSIKAALANPVDSLRSE